MKLKQKSQSTKLKTLFIKDRAAKDMLKRILESMSDYGNEELKEEIRGVLNALENASDEEVKDLLEDALKMMSNENPVKRPPLFTKDEVVKDILENMSIADKVRVKHTPKDELTLECRGWAMGLRNYYLMWHNDALVKDTGKKQPEDASMVIIEEVWETLQKSEEKGLEKIDKNVSFRWSETFQWDVDKKSLEIPCDGTSIVIERIDLDFAQAIAEGMEASLFNMRTRLCALMLPPK